MKKTLSYILRFGVSIGLLVWLGSRIDFRDTIDAQGHIQQGLFSVVAGLDWRWFIPGFLILFGLPWLFTLRWRILAVVQNIRLSYWQMFRLTYIGLFFNGLLPGAVAGDVVKSAYIFKNTECKTKAVMSVLIDRLAGFVCLAAICLAGLIFMDIPNPHFHLIKKIVLPGCIGVLVFVVLLFLFSRSKFLDRMSLFKIRLVVKIREAFNVYHSNLPEVAKACAAALGIHLIMIINNILFAQALGITGFPLWYFLVLVPLADLASLFPSIGGWGAGEAGYVFLLGLWGVPSEPALALSVLFRLSVMIWNLPGIFFTFRRDPGTNAKSTPGPSTE